MKILSLLCVCLVLWNCEDKQTHQNKTKSTLDSISKIDSNTEAKETNVEPNRKYPELTDKNAMELFLQYDKENKCY